MNVASSARRARRPLPVIAVAVAVGVVFEGLTVPETQVRAVWRLSPWAQDPYHTVVWVAQLAVPVLVVAIAVRLLIRGGSVEGDRAQQTARAAGAAVTLVALACAAEWAAVAEVGPGGSSSSRWQVAGLALASVGTVVAVVLLVGGRAPSGTSRGWTEDWWGDLVEWLRGLPGLRGRIAPSVTPWVRRHALPLFVLLSAVGGAGVAAAQVIGEDVTDVGFTGWLFVAETGANFALCMVLNAAAGFVVRPPRSAARAIAERSAVLGCVALLGAIAFHDQLWTVLGRSGPVTVGGLAGVTLGAGMVTAVLAGLAQRVWAQHRSATA